MSGMELLTTERLTLRRMEAADASHLFELDADAEVRRYVHAGPPDMDRIRGEILPRMTAYDDLTDFVGLFAAEQRPSQRRRRPESSRLRSWTTGLPGESSRRSDSSRAVNSSIRRRPEPWQQTAIAIDARFATR